MRAGVRLEGYLVAGHLLSARLAAPAARRALTIIFLAIQIRSFDFSRAIDLRAAAAAAAASKYSRRYCALIHVHRAACPRWARMQLPA